VENDLPSYGGNLRGAIPLVEDTEVQQEGRDPGGGRRPGGGDLMSHSELVQRAKRWLLNTQRCAFALTELTTAGVFQTPDALGFKSFGESILVECKVSRSDFRADIRKRNRQPYGDVLGWLRYYMVPEGLIKAEEVPAGWGLLYVTARRVRIVKGAISRGDPIVAQSERHILISMLRRVHIHGKMEELLRLPRKERRKE